MYVCRGILPFIYKNEFINPHLQTYITYHNMTNMLHCQLEIPLLQTFMAYATHCCPSEPKILNFLSSANITWLHQFSYLLACSFANWCLFFLFTSFKYGFSFPTYADILALFLHYSYYSDICLFARFFLNRCWSVSALSWGFCFIFLRTEHSLFSCNFLGCPFCGLHSILSSHYIPNNTIFLYVIYWLFLISLVLLHDGRWLVVISQTYFFP